jgi:hypothetical protein
MEINLSLTGRVLEWNINLSLVDDSFKSVLDGVSQILPPHTTES